MTWFKVDDSFYDHPKVFDAPDCALALWVRAGTWSARNLTNGYVPTGMPARLCDDPDTAVKELVRRGLWSRTRSGYQFHDWDQYQPTSDQVLDLRAKRAEAGRRGGLAKAAKQTASNGLANASPVGKQNAAPARPGPVEVQEGDLPQGGRPPDPEPPRQCHDHLNDPDPPPCGPCANARRRWERWQTDHTRADQAQRSADAQAAAEARRTAFTRCQLCDHRGYLPSGIVCAHDPGRLAAAKRGAAAARAAIQRPPATEDP